MGKESHFIKDRDRHTERRVPREATERHRESSHHDGSRDQNDASICQGMPRLLATPEAREKHEMDSPLESEKGTNPANTWTPDIWPVEL